MRDLIQHSEKIKTLTLQAVNCCLAYSLSLPIELDINAVMYLAKDYLGVFSLLTIFNRNSVLLPAHVSDPEIEKSFEKLAA